MSASGYEGALRILRYNGRFFLLAGLLVVLAGSAALSRTLSPGVAMAAALLATLTLASMALSLVVSHYVYDRSTLARWDWLLPRIEPPPCRWIAIHAGLDDATPALRRLFPGAFGRALDVYDPRDMTEPSIAAARRLDTPPERATPVSAIALPLATGSSDLVVLFFVAHELRRAASREGLFGELGRIVAPGGRVVVVEHLRDLANVLAFGPGALHFLPRREWLRLAASGGLVVREEARLTPFVRAFFLARPA